MSRKAYAELAVSWQPTSRQDSQFRFIAIATVAVFLLVGIAISFIRVPDEPRREGTPVPDRIAQYIIEQEPPPPPPPPPEPPKPKPPKPKPTVERVPDRDLDQKPLTEEQITAREKAEKTGLIALGNELADLIDTSTVDEMVNTRVSEVDGSQAVGVSSDIITAKAGQGSGGVDGSAYASSVSSTQLSAREVAQVRQTLLSGGANAVDRSRQSRSAEGVRSEEGVSVVFDRNKGRLHSIYNRARRSNPGLQGKIVLELTIAPDGKVSSVRIISSELNDPELEKRLLARIRLFDFGAQDVEALTVTWPIEFLPS